MRCNQKGFTLVELLLSLGLLGVVVLIIFPFLISNLNNYKRNEVELTLQQNSRTATEFIFKELIDAKSIIAINDKKPNAFSNYSEIDIYSIVFSIVEEKNRYGYICNRKMFEIKGSEDGNKLTYGVIRKSFISNYTNMEVAFYIDKMKVKPIMDDYDRQIGIIFTLYLEKDGYSIMPVKSSVYFRNHD